MALIALQVYGYVINNYAYISTAQLEATRHILHSKENKLFIVLAGFFLTNALIAEFIGVKIFSLESTIGIPQVQWTILGLVQNLDLTAGVVLWPVVFVMTDVINEYYGRRGVRMLSYLTAGLVAFAFLMVYFAIHLEAAGWWVEVGKGKGVENMQAAFRAIFGQGLWIIVGSLCAFLIGQLLDVIVFQRLKRITGESKVWLRATGSTLVSQLIDSFVVLYIAFYIGADWGLQDVLSIGLNNYIYKFGMAIALTPLIYLAHWLIDRYLGAEKAEALKASAMDK